MARRIVIRKEFLEKDLLYNSFLVNILINKVLKNGKKFLARNIVYKSFDMISKDAGKNPVLIFEKAVRNVQPKVGLKAVIVENTTYRIPVLINKLKSAKIAIRWIVESSKKRKKKSAANCLFLEILDASRNTGLSVKKKEDLHKMAEANKSLIE